MAAVGTVTLKTEQYETMLEKIKQKTESASGSMSQSMGKVGSQLGKAGGVLKSLGASIGSSFGALSSIISGITAGPLAAFSAAIGAAVALGAEIWDKMTMSASEYAAELERVSREAEKTHQSMMKQMDEDAGYMDRLAELAKKENLSNEAKTEAAALIQMLTSRYGDLGIEIDAVTGRITGMDAAQDKFLQKQREMKSASLQRQIDASEKSTTSKAMTATNGMAIGEETLQKFGLSWRGMSDARATVAGVFNNEPLEKQLEFATKMRDDVSKTKDDKANWQAVIDELLKRMDLRDQKKMLEDTSYETEAKAAAAARRKTQEAEAKAAEEQQAKDYSKSFYDRQAAMDKALEDKRQRGRDAESDYAFAHASSDEEKIENREARIKAEEEHIRQLDEAKKNVDVFALGAEEAEKKLHEYDMAIEDAKQKITGFRHQIEEVQNAPKKQESELKKESKTDRRMKSDMNTFQTDALTARGAIVGGAMNAENKNEESIRKIRTTAETIKTIIEQINDNLRWDS